MEPSKYITRHLDRLLLDPNNYRFIDHRDYKKVSMDEVADQRIQLRTYNLLVGKNNENIRDLIGSFKSNGILKLDPIQVKETPDGKYIVIEGNRRTAALKFLQSEHKSGNDVGKLTLESFKSLDVVLISGESPVQHLITMGLHHISGKKKWSPVNQAQLIYDLKHNHGQDEEEIIDSLSITKHGLRRALRTLALVNAYKESDFGDQFQPTQYSIFEEIIKTQSVKSWLGWDDSRFICTRKNNEERLFNWISEEEYAGEDDERDELIKRDPIITKSHEIRELGKFINDDRAVSKMEESRSVTKGFVLSEAVGEQKLKNALDNLGKDVGVAFQFSEYMSSQDIGTIAVLRDKIDNLIPSSKALISKSELIQTVAINSEVASHFSNFEVISLGRLKNLKIKHLSRINIFAGANNAGKTTLLEAFHLATQLNNLRSFVEQERFRGKFYHDFKSYWLDRNFLSDISISSIFNGKRADLKIFREEDSINNDKSHYLTSLCAEANVDEARFASTIHLFNNKEPEEFYEIRRTLCRSAFTSPFRYNEDQLARAYDAAVSDKYLDRVVNFLRDKVDPKIETIDMSSDKRFLVASTQFTQAVDITRFGEGLQRIFEIALLMGLSRNGIICIDEVDAAIHKSLLVNFTRFIQELAEEFKVQVFVSTHSKECIDAFLQNGSPLENITAHSLSCEGEEIVCKHLPGDKLSELIDFINFDIR